MRSKWPFVILVALILVGLATANHLTASREKSPVTALYPKDPLDTSLWPNSQTRVWSVNGLDPNSKGEYVSLVARVVHEKLEKNKSMVVQSRLIS